MAAKTYPVMLTIAGSDPSGGAGIQADIKTASALGVYAMSVITALTAQNTQGVAGFEPVSMQLLKAQLRAVLTDIRPDAVKIGMIPSGAHVSLIARILREFELQNIVLDPVLVATSGDALSEGDTVQTLLTELAPLSQVITPNMPEARVLAGREIPGLEQAIDCAHELLKISGAASVLLKGGHGTSPEEIIDIYVDKNNQSLLAHPRISSQNTHGTGCTLSSAIASLLAMGLNRDVAVVRGVEWLQKALKAGSEYKIGHGHGPVNHLFNIRRYEA